MLVDQALSLGQNVRQTAFISPDGRQTEYQQYFAHSL